MTTIKTIQLLPGGGFDKIVVATTGSRDPGPGEIRVRIHASSLNYHDYRVVTRGVASHETRIPMSDGAGEVVAIGAGVSEFKVGDHVVSTFFPDWQDGEPIADSFARTPGDGIDGYAREEVTAHTTAFTHAPQGYSHAEAATLTTAGLTAWRTLIANGQLKPGDTVLLQGTGGVSIFALQFAKVAGARVIATSSNDAKLARMKALGADELINYRTDPDWGMTARRLTHGRGVDHVIEVGGAATLPQSMLATRVGGHVAMIGILSGIEGPLSIRLALSRQLRLQAVLVGNRTQQRQMIKAIEANNMRPVIDKHFALEQIADAFRYQESGQHFGKIVLDI